MLFSSHEMAGKAQISPEQFQTLQNGPAGPPPPGVAPNLHDPANLDGLVILTLILCLTFATLAISMRMFTKLFLIRSFDYEDCKQARFDMYCHNS